MTQSLPLFLKSNLYMQCNYIQQIFLHKKQNHDSHDFFIAWQNCYAGVILFKPSTCLVYIHNKNGNKKFIYNEMWSLQRKSRSPSFPLNCTCLGHPHRLQCGHWCQGIKRFLKKQSPQSVIHNAFQQINHNTPTRLAKHWGQVKEYGLGISKDLESKSMGYGTSFMLLRKIVLNW